VRNKQRWVAILGALVVVGSGVTAVRSRAATPVASLSAGKSAFWNGAFVEEAYTDVPGAAACKVV